MAPVVEFTAASEAQTALIAHLHAASWRASYRGIIPDDYLDSRAEAERLATWEARLRDHAEGSIDVTVAWVGGKAAGFGCLLPEHEPEHGVYVDNLHVLPAFQGLGLGKELLARCARLAALTWPGKALYLYVLDANGAAREFYRRIGGIESQPFEDRFPGPGTIVTVRRVTWPDVPALIRRLVD